MPKKRASELVNPFIRVEQAQKPPKKKKTVPLPANYFEEAVKPRKKIGKKPASGGGPGTGRRKPPVY